jgi:hypothetical protein
VREREILKREPVHPLLWFIAPSLLFWIVLLLIIF